MKIVVIMHVENEGSGTLGDFLDSAQASVSTVRTYAGEPLPADVNGMDAVVSMGGPMNVHEQNEYTFLRDEIAFLKRAVDAGVPMLGICLGAQLIASACGARVYKAPVKELGWSRVSLTPEGRRDNLFKDLPDTLSVLQWHEYTFQVPTGGSLLATSDPCPHQAFRLGNAYGLQFHPEVTLDMLSQWSEDEPEEQRNHILRRFGEMEHHYVRQADTLYSNFLTFIRENTHLRS